MPGENLFGEVEDGYLILKGKGFRAFWAASSLLSSQSLLILHEGDRGRQSLLVPSNMMIFDFLLDDRTKSTRPNRDEQSYLAAPEISSYVLLVVDLVRAGNWHGILALILMQTESGLYVRVEVAWAHFMKLSNFPPGLPVETFKII